MRRALGLGLIAAVSAVGVVTYPNGRYVLMGAGVTAPYYWVWQPTVMIGGPPPPPAG